MSLVVSLRIPDGIVVAADSLATSHTLLEFAAPEVEVQCPRCEEKISASEFHFAPVPIPFSASSFTQKLFALKGKFALSSFGLGILNNRSIYYHIKQFEHLNETGPELNKTVDAIVDYFEQQLVEQFPGYKQDAPKDHYPLGMHLNGYEYVEEQPIAVTYEVYIGRENVVRRNDVIGCTIGGDLRVVQKLWEIGREDARRAFKYGLFSLQDAIDLSEFLINATSTSQRFANEVSTVGGEVDIALLTPFHDFQWIKQKTLMERVEKTRLEA